MEKVSGTYSLSFNCSITAESKELALEQLRQQFGHALAVHENQIKKTWGTEATMENHHNTQDGYKLAYPDCDECDRHVVAYIDEMLSGPAHYTSIPRKLLKCARRYNVSMERAEAALYTVRRKIKWDILGTLDPKPKPLDVFNAVLHHDLKAAGHPVDIGAFTNDTYDELWLKLVAYFPELSEQGKQV